jgi:hypothetical protein
MQVLLVSTYELGRQPVHISSPAAALRAAGHEVAAVDLSVEDLTEDLIDDAEAIALSVPMHTAKRLADEVSVAVRSFRPNLPIAHYGLYAGVGFDVGGPVDLALEGEYEPGLLAWLATLGRDETQEPGVARHTGRSDFLTPDRRGLPALDSYARLEHDGKTVIAAAVEASHGCRHRCRHCPIPTVYDGRMRVVPQEVSLADIDRVVEAGAGHITFGDPDFLNAPKHSIAILEQAHASHPDVTFDATIKVEHILRDEDLWPHLAEQNLLFVVSAFESVDEATLEILDKGHTVADMARAVEILTASGVHIRPTWLPFVPWTETSHLISLLRFIDDLGLHGAIDPVQLAIKLLIPGGSLLESHPAVTPHLTTYDTAALTWRWRFANPEAEVLQKELDQIAAEASDCGAEVTSTLQTVWSTVESITGESLGSIRPGAGNTPRLTESWYCCAEPTEGQTVSIQLGQR